MNEREKPMTKLKSLFAGLLISIFFLAPNAHALELFNPFLVAAKVEYTAATANKTIYLLIFNNVGKVVRKITMDPGKEMHEVAAYKMNLAITEAKQNHKMVFYEAAAPGPYNVGQASENIPGDFSCRSFRAHSSL
jgi:hypothetical protein